MKRTIRIILMVVMILAVSTISIAATTAPHVAKSVIVYTADGDQLCSYIGKIVFDNPNDYSRFTVDGKHFGYQGQYIIEVSD